MVKFATDTKDMLKIENVKYMIMKYTGEELLAYVLQSAEESPPRHYYLFNPVKITNMMNPLTGGVQYLMSEWISTRISDDEGFEIVCADILVMADVEIGMLKSYMKFTEKIEAFKERMREQASEDDDPQIHFDDEGQNQGAEEDHGQGGDSSDDEDELSPEDEALLEHMSRTIQPKKSTLH